MSNEQTTLADDLRAAINDISTQLKGPGIPFALRLELHEQRKDFRKRLADIEAQEKP